MTGLAVERDGTAIRVGALVHPERAALVEARGALLCWDVLDLHDHPAAVIHDAARAGEWLWEVYGPEPAAAVLGGADAIAPEADSPVLEAARALALLRWAEAWWPSSWAAGVPPLPGPLLRAETAWRTAGIEHLLDDDSAVERALADVDAAALGDYPDPRVADLRADLEDLAEDHGVELAGRASERREDYALAAGGGREGDLVLRGGTAPVDWGGVPQGMVDAAEAASWTLAQRGPDAMVTVTVPAAPEAGGGRLAARLGATALDLEFDPMAGAFVGEAPAPQGFPAEPELRVFAPGHLAEPDIDAARRRSAIIAFARARLAAPETLTESAAARA